MSLTVCLSDDAPLTAALAAANLGGLVDEIWAGVLALRQQSAATGSELNAKFSVSNAQKIQKFAVVPGDFTEKGGELTATLKLKRGPAAAKYADVIEAMYK